MSEQRCQGWLWRVLVKSGQMAGPRGSEGGQRSPVKGGLAGAPEGSNARGQEGVSSLAAPGWIVESCIFVPMRVTGIPAQP